VSAQLNLLSEVADDAQPRITRHRQRMLDNVGKHVRKVFYVNGTNGILDYYEGVVDHITEDDRYHIVYSDNDSEEMSISEFKRFHRHDDKARDVAAQAATMMQELSDNPPAPPRCKCHSENVTCHHPWGSSPASMDPLPMKPLRVATPGVATKMYDPAATLNQDHQIDFYAMSAFGRMCTKIDVRDELARACMYKFSPINPNVPHLTSAHIFAAAARTHKTKLSAYAPDPTTIPACRTSPDWTTTEQGNTWCESILSEWGNLMKFGVVELVHRSEVPEGTKILPTIINFLTKRRKESTPAQPAIDKRKTRICLGGHKCVPGVDFDRLESYAPVPGWGVVKIQLALTALHGYKLKAFDCTAAYLQTPMPYPVYAKPPHGLMDFLKEQGQTTKGNDTVWKLNRCLYGHPLGASLWYRKLFTFLKAYGFQQLGNSASFMILRRTTGEHQGVILLNVYSDDGLASIDNEELWRQFMNDFKRDFDVEEKDPDYFLGAGIKQNSDGSIEIDPSKYLREVISKYDMDRAITSPLPMPAGTKLYMDHGTPLNDEEINFFQQMTGSIMYASLLRPELCYYASQLGKVMSAPTDSHMMFARKVLQFIAGTLEDTHTFHPVGHAGFSEDDVKLMAFTDSDWACAMDTRRSHGCYTIMLAGAAITWRSRSHKSIMLSTAAAEYYEASEACREIAFVRGILEDFYNRGSLPPTPLYIDNQACIAMGMMPQFTEKQKHIPIRICHLKECREDGMVELRHVSTTNQLADIGTKALAQPTFERLRHALRGATPFSYLLHQPLS
jgi:hypothetical protein